MVNRIDGFSVEGEGRISTARHNTMTEDDQLMIRIQSGDSRAFEELVDRYQAALIGFFYRNTHDRQASEDLTQETLLRVFNQSRITSL